MIILFDTDIVVYQAGFAAERVYYKILDQNKNVVELMFEPATAVRAKYKGMGYKMLKCKAVSHVSHALHMTKLIIEKACNNIQDQYGNITERYFYLTSNDRSNFRFEAAKTLPYKGNRKDFVKPTHYAAIRDYIVQHLYAQMVEGKEADDAISMKAAVLRKAKLPFVIVSKDKDLLQIPGIHYRMQTCEFVEVSESSALRSLYTQVLLGDTSDNIPGLKFYFKKGLFGPKKADEIFFKCETESDYVGVLKEVWNTYNLSDEEFDVVLKENLTLLRLLTK